MRHLAFPLTAILLEYFLRHNLLGPLQWLGVLLLFTGIFKVSRLNGRVVAKDRQSRQSFIPIPVEELSENS